MKKDKADGQFSATIGSVLWTCWLCSGNMLLFVLVVGAMLVKWLVKLAITISSYCVDTLVWKFSSCRRPVSPTYSKIHTWVRQRSDETCYEKQGRVEDKCRCRNAMSFFGCLPLRSLPRYQEKPFDQEGLMVLCAAHPSVSQVQVKTQKDTHTTTSW